MLPRVFIDLGFMQVYTFGFMVAVGIILGGYFSLLLARKKSISTGVIFDTIFYGLISGVIGARFIYVLLNLSEYITMPAHIFHVQSGGMSLHGGLLGGLLAVIYQARKYDIKIWTLLDILAPGVALAVAVGRIGCDIYGISTTLPWGVSYQGVKVHPVQAYSFIFNTGLFYYLWRKSREKLFAGAIFLKFIIIYSTFRFLMEYLRGGYYLWGIFTAGQITSLALIISGIIIYRQYSKTQAARSFLEI